MKHLTDDQIRAEHESLWQSLIGKFGSEYRVPSGEVARVGDILRAMYVLQMFLSGRAGGSSVRTFMESFSLPEDAIGYVLARFYGGEQRADQPSERGARPSSRKDKWGTFDKWAKDNAGKQFTTNELVEVSGFSYQTTLRYVSESPLFVKVKNGLWKLPIGE